MASKETLYLVKRTSIPSDLPGALRWGHGGAPVNGSVSLCGCRGHEENSFAVTTLA